MGDNKFQSILDGLAKHKEFADSFAERVSVTNGNINWIRTCISDIQKDGIELTSTGPLEPCIDDLLALETSKKAEEREVYNILVAPIRSEIDDIQRVILGRDIAEPQVEPSKNGLSPARLAGDAQAALGELKKPDSGASQKTDQQFERVALALLEKMEAGKPLTKDFAEAMNELTTFASDGTGKAKEIVNTFLSSHREPLEALVASIGQEVETKQPEKEVSTFQLARDLEKPLSDLRYVINQAAGEGSSAPKTRVNDTINFLNSHAFRGTKPHQQDFDDMDAVLRLAKSSNSEVREAGEKFLSKHGDTLKKLIENLAVEHGQNPILGEHTQRAANDDQRVTQPKLDRLAKEIRRVSNER